jgi:4-amino-4-deoxy-L-arabinose transferase-like glycosyltransferase
MRASPDRTNVELSSESQSAPRTAHDMNRVLWLGLILVAAAALRLWGLGAKSLWLDEIMTVQKASMSFADMMGQIRRHDAHPPLFQIVEWLWLRVGKGDAYARAPSVVAGVACVWLCFLIARRLFGRKAAPAAAAMAALSYFGIFYSQEARLHSFMTALFLGQVCLLLAILERRGKAGWGLWLAYGLVGLASLYTYALCALTIGAMGLLYLWLTWRRHRQFGRWLAVHAAIALLFLPWVPTLQKRTAELEASIREYHDSIGRPTASEVAGGVTAWAIGPRSWQGSSRLGPMIGLGCLLAAAAAASWRTSRRPAKILGVLFFLPLLLYLVLPMPRVHLYEAKHLMFAQPILLIALSGARLSFRALGKERRSHILLIVVLGFAALNALGLRDYFRPGFEKENWRKLAADVSVLVAPNDLILFNPSYIGYAFDYYARLPADLPPIARAGAEPLLQPGVRIEGSPRRIWLIEDYSAVSRPFPQALDRLEAQGWYPQRNVFLMGVLGELRYTRFLPKGSP